MFEDYVKDYSGKAVLAKKLGISRMRLYQWQKGGVPFDKIKRVSDVTGISIVSLLLESYSKRFGTEGLTQED